MQQAFKKLFQQTSLNPRQLQINLFSAITQKFSDFSKSYTLQIVTVIFGLSKKNIFKWVQA